MSSKFLGGSILLLAAMSAFAAPSRTTPAASPPDSRPDILLITVDSLRADRLGSYGHRAASTPALDALAARGRRFTHATTPFPRTTPAIASLMTGLWPENHGSREVGEAMRTVPTLASLLQQAGYVTIGESATRVLSEDQGMHRGFASFHAERLHAGQLTDRANEALADAPRERPMMMWVHYFDPHFPYAPWPSWPQPRAPLCRELAYALTTSRTMSWAMLHGNQDGRARAALGDCSALYDAEISFTDHHIGRLLEEFEARRGHRPGIVVFTADHGENLGEGGLYYEHGPNLREASLLVPLIVAGTGVSKGTDETLVSLTDAAPTLLSFAGVAHGPAQFDGRVLPLSDADEDRAPADRVVFAESGTAFDPRYTLDLVSGRDEGMHCAHEGRYSLCLGSRGGLHLYDHEADPGFRTDLVKKEPEVVARLQRILRAWPAETARSHSARNARFKLVELPQPDGSYRGALYDLARDASESKDVKDEHPAVYAELARQLHGWRDDLRDDRARERRDETLIETLRSLGYIDD